MKLASIYSNKEEIFPAIYFHEGFNVIFAQVKDPLIKEQDSHNLGKTFLIQVLDFALLADIDKKHPFREHSDIFGDFTFYLEIETVNSEYVTVKRSVDSSRVSLHVSDQRHKDMREVPEIFWTHANLPKAKAEKELNSILDLKALGPFPYRKGLGYIMRRQSDYDEVFRISKFQYGADKYWKPFVALLLGFDQGVVEEKYAIDDDIKELETRLSVIEEEAGSTSGEYDEVRGLLEIRRASLEKFRSELDAFSFRDIEAQISETSISTIEAEVARLNERRYTLEYELQEIDKSLQYENSFDIQKIQEVFHEAAVVLPDALVRNYEELVEFNKRITNGRTERLQNLRSKLLVEKDVVDRRIAVLDQKRQEALQLLQDRQTIQKYKELQRILIERERQVIELEQRLSQLDQATNTQKEIDEENQKLVETVTKVRRSVREENQIYSAIRRTFSECVERVLNVQALLSVSVNQNGNLDFNVRTLDRDTSKRETSEALGTSYKKVLSACFDLTLLIVYSSKAFYRFVYHDGIFEGLDNRRKVSFLNMVREACDLYGIQYILTVIDSDLPRDDSDRKLLFTEEEIVRYLHDRGNEGRLFKTQAF